MRGIEEGRAATVVAIVSSNYLLRLGLQKIVEDEKWIRLTGQSAHGVNLDDLLKSEHPHIVILDTESEHTVQDMIRTIKEAVPAIKIILLATMPVTLPIELSASRVKRGLTSSLPASPPHTSAPMKWPEGLTEREREVVRLISEGLSNKDIADRLCISSITVRHHLTNIFDKLGVSNRQKLLIRAHQHGLVGPPALA